MRVAIDATSVPPRPAGAGVYAIELVRALSRLGARDGYALFTRGHLFDNDVAGLRNWRIERLATPSRAARSIWEQTRLPRTVARLGIDVLHSTHHTLPLVPMRCRRVVTVHDVTFFRTPRRYTPMRRFYMQSMTRLAATTADRIIVPSNVVKQDVQRFLGTSESKISTIYEAAGPLYGVVERHDAAATARRYGIDGPYVLSVGSLEPGKNRARLIRAMRSLRDEGLEHRLVVVGQRAWKYEGDLRLTKALAMDGHVAFLGYVPDRDMPALYSAASAFAFPSLYEGFGLPVLEAMACGTPVLTSNVSATGEIAGDAALLVDPRSVDAICDGLRSLLSDANLRESLSMRGLERAAQFSWPRAAQETHALYERVACATGGEAR